MEWGKWRNFYIEDEQMGLIPKEKRKTLNVSNSITRDKRGLYNDGFLKIFIEKYLVEPICDKVDHRMFGNVKVTFKDQEIFDNYLFTVYFDVISK